MTAAISDGDRSMLRYLTDKCHVGESRRAVCEYVTSKVTGFAALPRVVRLATVREVCRAHRANRQLYSDVMSGRIGNAEGGTP